VATRPTGTVSFLFTDIEGSRRLLHDLGDRCRDALEDHRRPLRETFEQHESYEVDTQGDAFFVAFARAQDAVRAAAEGQRRLAAHDWPDGRQLRVRMGIHTCERQRPTKATSASASTAAVAMSFAGLGEAQAVELALSDG
jgi:class 3 adenylate cyclase